MASLPGEKRISQETFDEVVEENIVDFEMSWEDAVADAITQFEAVGVNLSNIIKDVRKEDRVTVEHPVIAATKALIQAAREEPAEGGPSAAAASSEGGVPAPLQSLLDLVQGDKEAKTLASASGALPAIWALANAAPMDSHLTKLAYKTMRSICDGNNSGRAALPEDVVVQACDAILGGGLPEETNLLLHTSLVVFCTRTEPHKRTVHSSGLFSATLDSACAAVEGAAVPASSGADLGSAVSTLGDVTGTLLHAQVNLLRAVVSGDDSSAQVSKAFDFARELTGSKTGDVLFVAGSVMRSGLAVGMADAPPAALMDAMHLIRVLAVNDSTCVKFTDRGVLGLLVEAVKAWPKAAPIVKGACGALRKLAHSDHVKRAVCAGDAAALNVLMAGLQGFAGDVGVLEQALAALSVVSLRIPENALAIADKDAIPYVVDAMRSHPTAPGVQRQCCLCLRNLVSRNKEALRGVILEEGAEALLRAARAAHDNCTDVAWAALRDLGVE